MRKAMDCREYPSQTNCSLRISGEENEVVRAAVEHAISVHGEKDSPELREWIGAHLKNEDETGYDARRVAEQEAPSLH